MNLAARIDMVDAFWDFTGIDRAVYLWHFIKEMDFAEVGRRLNRPVCAIKASVWRVRWGLKRKFGGIADTAHYGAQKRRSIGYGFSAEVAAKADKARLANESALKLQEQRQQYAKEQMLLGKNLKERMANSIAKLRKSKQTPIVRLELDLLERMQLQDHLEGGVA